MRTWMMTLAALVALPAAVSAQEEMDRRMEELRREHDKARKQLEERFRGEMERLEQEFKKRAEEFHRGRDQRGEKRDERGHGERGHGERGHEMQPGMERLAQALHQLLERVERLEQMLKGRGGEERRDFRHEERGGRPDFRPEERRGEERGRPGMDCPCRGKCEGCHPRPGDRKPEGKHDRKPERKPDHHDYY